MNPPGPVKPAEHHEGSKGEAGNRPLLFLYAIQEPDMLQDIPTPTLREASSCVLETERLTLRRPTLADVKAIARLANDRRIAENTRRLPHPYLQEHAVEFVRATAASDGEPLFLIEQNHSPM